MKRNDSHRSPTIPVAAVSNAQYSPTKVRVTRIPRRHQSSINQSHYISTKVRQTKSVIHRTIRPPSSIVSIGKENTELNASLNLTPSHLITHKHRYQSRSHITQSLVQWPNKISPTSSAKTHLRCHDSLSVMEDTKQKHVTDKLETSIIEMTTLPSVEVTENKDLVVNDSFRFGSRTHTVKHWDIETVDNHRRSLKRNNNLKKKNSCRPCSPLCAFLSFLAVALLLGTIATILATLLIRANTTTTISTTPITATTITTVTTTTGTTTSTTTTSSTTTNTVTTTTTITTSSTTTNTVTTTTTITTSSTTTNTATTTTTITTSSTTTNTATTTTTMTTSSTTTNTATTTTTSSTTTSTATTTTSRTTSTTTTTTTPPYCATTCTGNHTNYGNATTCGHICVDLGAFICQNNSTYCAGSTFTINGYCDAGNGNGTCPTGYCCVYDNFIPSTPYVCMICNSVG